MLHCLDGRYSKLLCNLSATPGISITSDFPLAPFFRKFSGASIQQMHLSNLADFLFYRPEKFGMGCCWSVLPCSVFAKPEPAQERQRQYIIRPILMRTAVIFACVIRRTPRAQLDTAPRQRCERSLTSACVCGDQNHLITAGPR